MRDDLDGCNLLRRLPEIRVTRVEPHTYYSQPVREGNKAFPVFDMLSSSSKDAVSNTIVEENIDTLEKCPPERRVIIVESHTYYSQPVREGNKAFPVFDGLKNSSPKDKVSNIVAEENSNPLEKSEEQSSFQKVLKK